MPPNARRVPPKGLAVGAADDGAGAPATVRVATFLGATTRLHLTTDSGAVCKADLPSWEAAALAPGTRCTITPHENPVLVAERAGAPSLKV
ncbi:TOBE domain-containing protein [Streptomyces sp. MBT60]|uniref:TOBE domain-containing protein n=1 Tax=Streptomyces sp. MBT60 TaxID=2800409 RepID=UPI0027DE150B|nr:TOBE domain-containing protein [Streptomyces sp. MBT60]